MRFLPPHDPCLLLRDRSTLIPDKKLHRLIWRAAGNPGMVLSDGRPVALWRPQKKGNRLGLTVEVFEASARHEIEAEAATVAPFKGCTNVDVKFKRL